MTARIYTPEEEVRLGLRSLPEVPWIGVEESQRKRAEYETGRVAYRVIHPIIENVEPGDIGYAATRTKP